MPRGLVHVAIWLGTRGFAGIWRFGGGGEHFRDVEVFGAIGNSKSTALFDALTVYNVTGQNLPLWRPYWYRDRFNAWAKEILCLHMATGIKPPGTDTSPGKLTHLSGFFVRGALTSTTVQWSLHTVPEPVIAMA